jgi:hypothetical protein
MRHIALILSIAMAASAETVVSRNPVVQVSADGTQTIPPNTIALPAQVEALTAEAAENLSVATGIQAQAATCVGKVRLFSTNYVVTSTVYVQSIGGTPYDPSNQTIRVQSIAKTATNILIVATVRQLPLVPPALDWRVALGAGGAWSNLSATVSSVDIPEGVTNAVAAYQFALPIPSVGSSFFRVVDNSSGASGSGLWWLVYGGIYVDGQKGLTGMVGTNRFVGGILVEASPLGE